MFYNIYTNCVYLLLLLYSPNKYQDDSDRKLVHYNRNRVFQTKTHDEVDKCDDQEQRIRSFVQKSMLKLVERLSMVIYNATDSEIELKSRLSLDRIHVLRQYLPQDYSELNCEQLEEFEDTLDAVIDSLVVFEDKKFYYSMTDFIVKFVAIFGYFCILVFTYFSVKKLFKLISRQNIPNIRTGLTLRLVIIGAIVSVTLVSIAWKWRQKYLIELSRKQCYVLSTPDECLNRVSDLTFISWIRHYIYSYEDRRHNYYRAVTVDPFWEINPFSVISELFSDLIFTPLKPLGDYSGQFLSSLFKHIPLYLVIPVFTFLIICVLLLVLLAAIWLLMPNRYTLKIPFLMSISLERNQNQPIGRTEESSEAQVVRRYQIRANVVNVYQSLGPNDTNSGIDLSQSRIKFDENLTFDTNEPVFIPYSELD